MADEQRQTDHRTLEDLKQALEDVLDHRGVLGRIKSQVRKEVFHTLRGPQDAILRPPLSNDNLLINELIREYLEYNGYENTLSVLMAESGQPNDGVLNRGFLRSELGLYERNEPDWKIPLLYGIIHALKRWKEAARTEGTAADFCGPPRVPMSGDQAAEAADMFAQEQRQLPFRTMHGQAAVDVVTHEDPAPILFKKNDG